MIHPFLIGSNVYLRGLDEKDIEGNYFQWFNDQEVNRHNSHGMFPNNFKKMKEYLDFVYAHDTILVLAIINKANDEHVGNISLQGIDWVVRSAEYAIIMGEKKFWGKGLAKEASDLVIDHGFNSLNLNRIYCGTSSGNIPMQRLADHMGMKKEGVRRNAIFKCGYYEDVYEYGILRDEYLAKNK